MPETTATATKLSVEGATDASLVTRWKGRMLVLVGMSCWFMLSHVISDGLLTHSWAHVDQSSLSIAHFRKSHGVSRRATLEEIKDRVDALAVTAAAHDQNQAQPKEEADEANAEALRGLIMCLFDDIVPMGLALIQELRCLGYTELIQVYYCLPDELSRANRDLLTKEFHVELVDVCYDMMDQNSLHLDMAPNFRSWWLKPLALLHTKLDEVLLVDADAFFLQNPALVRQSRGYQETGTMFMYDRVTGHGGFFDQNYEGDATKSVLQHLLETYDYSSLELEGFVPSQHLLNSFAWKRETNHEMDSSLVAIDKRRGYKAMDVLFQLITNTRFQMQFSHGDKEAFWLSYEISQTPYAFSPWGVSVISSSTNQDMELHPDSLCGNMAHWVPFENDTPELLYINGKALFEPFPLGVHTTVHQRENILFNMHPTHVSPRQRRRTIVKDIPYPIEDQVWADECLVGLGSTPLPSDFSKLLLQRRTRVFALKTGITTPLFVDECVGAASV